MTRHPKAVASSLPDTVLIERFMFTQRILLSLAALVGVVVQCAWMLPGLGRLLPQGWALMKSDTAIVILCSILGLVLSQRRQARAFGVAKAVAAIELLVAGSALFGHLTGHILPSGLLALNAEAPQGPMSLHTSIFFSLMGAILLVEPMDKAARRPASDVLTFMLAGIVLVILSGYLFNAEALVGISRAIRTSPHTLGCMMALVFSAVVLRLHAGPYSMLVSIGIGSHIARLTVLWSMLIPLAIVSAGIFSLGHSLSSIAYAGALMASSMALLLLAVTFWMAGRINRLELELRDQSLTDELTGIHNRRGFYLIGEYLFSEARRERFSLSVLFFDLDGLKRVNDTLGHDAGSELIRDFSRLLSAGFRDSDVVARLGGDEFAVVVSRGRSMDAALERLEKSVEALNAEPGRAYRISYSVGQVSGDPEQLSTFDSLVSRADQLMYEQKQRRKAQREEAEPNSWVI